MKQPRALEAAEKSTSKPPPRWAIKTLKRNIDLGGRVAIALEEGQLQAADACFSAKFANLTARLGFLFERE